MWDLIIVGGGPAGLTAAIYSSRAKLKTLLLEKISCGGQIVLTDIVENYPGFPEGITGIELIQKMKQQAEKFGTQIRYEEVKKIEKKENLIIKSDTQIYETFSTIIATGRSFKKLGVNGEEKLIGKGVSYCATCDGAFFKNKEVVVVGGGDTALEEAIFLTKFASKVTVIHRREMFRGTKILQERLMKNSSSVEILFSSQVLEILGEEKVEAVKVKNLKNGEVKEIKCEGVFIAVGHKPNTEFLKNFIELDEEGYIFVSEDLETSQKGVFACGDVIKKKFRQAINACGEGALASYSALKYIEKLKGIEYK